MSKNTNVKRSPPTKTPLEIAQHDIKRSERKVKRLEKELEGHKTAFLQLGRVYRYLQRDMGH